MFLERRSVIGGDAKAQTAALHGRQLAESELWAFGAAGFGAGGLVGLLILELERTVQTR